MYNLSILMTTYNSEKYIKEQIDSILNQSYQDWYLFIRDDNSSDNTRQLLKSYAKADNRIKILEDSVKRGAKHGFMWMLECIESDFYMFCDHDDVWLPNKIQRSLDLIKSQQDNKTKPIIVCTNAKLVDSHLNVIEESYWLHKCHCSSMFSDKYYHLFYNNVLGCTMLFNHKVKELAFPYPEETAMHDSWVAATTLWHGGKILPIEEPLILYRQHSDNTIGAPQMPTLFQQLKNCRNLFQKTSTQYHASQTLVNISLPSFFLIKTKYMLREHARQTLKKIGI